jgi:hypothetical protein
MANNSGYLGCSVDDQYNNNKEIIDESLVEEENPIEDGKLINQVIVQSDRANNASFEMQRNDEDVVQYSTSGLLNIEQSQNNIPITELPTPYVKVKLGNSWLKDCDPIFYGASFPMLFPYNEGHPNAKRPVPLSAAQYMRRILNCYDRRHSQDAAFILFMFDLLNRRRVMQHLSVTIHRNPEIARTHAIEVTQEKMKSLLGFNSAKAQAYKLGLPPPNVPSDLFSENLVMKSVTSATRRARGGAEERKEMAQIVTAAVNVRLQ